MLWATVGPMMTSRAQMRRQPDKACGWRTGSAKALNRMVPNLYVLGRGQIDWIYTEARFNEGLYAGAPLVNDIYVYLIQRGFKLHRISNVSHDQKGDMMECDMLFERLN
jgi:hypothetical protein